VAPTTETPKGSHGAPNGHEPDMVARAVQVQKGNQERGHRHRRSGYFRKCVSGVPQLEDIESWLG
jgi:hypothetical protein